MTIIANYKLEIVLLPHQVNTQIFNGVILDVMNQKPYIDSIQLRDLIVCLYQQVLSGFVCSALDI